MLDTDDSTNSSDSNSGSPSDRPVVPPKRVRVSALAKELGIPSKQLVALLADLGEGAKTASSTLDQAQADRARAAHAAPAGDTPPEPAAASEPSAGSAPPVAPAAAVLFQAPAAEKAPSRRRRAASAPAGPPPGPDEPAAEGPDITVAEDAEDQTAEPEDVREAAEAEAANVARRRRRRGRRGRGGGGGAQKDADDSDDGADEADTAQAPEPGATETAGDAADGESADDSADETDAAEGSPNTRRRRRRRRTGSGGGDGETEGESSEDDPPNTVVHVRAAREQQRSKSSKGSGSGSGSGDSKSSKDDDGDDGVRGVKGSTRLEARRQRRRDGRETNRRRPPILTESEFLARREAVDRVMAVRQHGDRTQIAVLEDNVLVEHYVTRASATSYVGNVYLGRVQNVLPSMEAAFIDIGKGRNGVLYAGEVNWDAAGLEGKSRAIEQALKSGDAVLVQVTKDPIGHKGARLTSQVSLPGRFLVYVPGGGMTGISRRLPDNERHRLKSILKKIVPEDAGVIVRTAAEGATEDDLTRDVERLQAEWASIQKKAAKTSAAPSLVHGEPDLAIRVVRDVFNEDFNQLIVQGDEAWQTISEYLEGVAPDLAQRSSHFTGGTDLFHDLRVDEQIMKALDRKVWLPSGGSLVIDRTEAMTVIDVNTGKFVGSGGNLEQTVTRNNLEAAEEIVRQLRLRDVGGIVVIDFIDMVLESNRELVLRRLTECLGRDRTKHQVAEVTSLGLVQMTRKRVGEGLLEAFSETCEVCHGRGVIIQSEPVAKGPSSSGSDDDGETRSAKPRRKRGGKQVAEAAEPEVDPEVTLEQRTKALAAMSAIHRAAHANGETTDAELALELDAVEAALADTEAEADRLAAETISAPDEAQPPSDPTADAVDAVAGVEVVATEPEPQPNGTEPDSQRNGTEPELELAVTAVAVKAARPRRRRAASRPAGPPTTG
jgi:ribonuclease E